MLPVHVHVGSAATEARLKRAAFAVAFMSAPRGHPLSKAKAAANRAKSRIRVPIEHVLNVALLRKIAHCSND